MKAVRPDGFYWVEVEHPVKSKKAAWEPARWHKGMWLTLGGPFNLDYVVKVGARIPDPPTDMRYNEVRER